VFSLEGPARRAGQNRLLAAWLSVIAGYVNSGGFLIVGSFTSHVTGHAGRLANDVVQRDFAAAGRAFLLVLAFFLGAFGANLLLLTRLISRRAWMYSLLLLVEAALLGLFAHAGHEPLELLGSRLADIKAAVLCFAMGLQNSMVTLISDARVRTTHLTGVVTDLGIEAARWVRWSFGHASRLLPLEGRITAVSRPKSATSLLLLTILFGFLVGAVLGAEGTTLYGPQALYAPALALLLAALYSAWTGRRTQPSVEPGTQYESR
jgi:uncharacterized membrane protein YoaK (UPF0700 family)